MASNVSLGVEGRVWGLGFTVQGIGFGIWGIRFRGWESLIGVRVQEPRVWGLGTRL